MLHTKRIKIVKKSLEQLEDYRAHYQSIYYYANKKGKPILRWQLRKLTLQIKQLHNMQTRAKLNHYR